MEIKDRIKGLVLGTAVGDSLGLPAEGLSSRAIQYLWRGRWKQRFFFGSGMCSDDTEHTLIVCKMLMLFPFDANNFSLGLARRLRWWLLLLPAGIGKATLKSILKLWCGFPPDKSGVYSAGNGPAMRSAVFGAFFTDDREKLREYVAASTNLTHTDPRALTGALAVAYAARLACLTPEGASPALDTFYRDCRGLSNDPEWQEKINLLIVALREKFSVAEYAAKLGLSEGVTGYTYHTVPVALYAWLRHYGDFRQTLESALNLGGDTDTVGAIVGALAGCSLGWQAIPPEWLSKIKEWPRSVEYMSLLSEKLADTIIRGTRQELPTYNRLLLPVRNLFFNVIVLLHAFFRLRLLFMPRG